MNLVCYVYKRELEASSNAIRSLLSKSLKYSWAKEAHDAAIVTACLAVPISILNCSREIVLLGKLALNTKYTLCINS